MRINSTAEFDAALARIEELNRAVMNRGYGLSRQEEREYDALADALHATCEDDTERYEASEAARMDI